MCVHHEGRNQFHHSKDKSVEEGKIKGVGVSALTAISSSSELSFSWMAVNPPCSPNWRGKKKITQRVKGRDDKHNHSARVVAKLLTRFTKSTSQPCGS